MLSNLFLFTAAVLIGNTVSFILVLYMLAKGIVTIYSQEES
jgi:hypothetical protein